MIMKIEGSDKTTTVYQITSYEHEKEDNCWCFDNQEDLEIFIDYSSVDHEDEDLKGDGEITIRTVEASDYIMDKMIVGTPESESPDNCNIKLYSDNLVLMVEWKDNKYINHF